MLIYKYFDTIVVFGWSAFVLVFRDLVIQYSIIPQTYSIDSFLEKNRQIVHTVWSVKDGAAETQREPGFMAGFWQSQPCPNLIFCCKPTKAGSQWVSDVPSFLTDYMVNFLVDDFQPFNLHLDF